MEDIRLSRGAPYLLSEAKYKGVLSFAEESLTIATSLTEAAPNDPERVLLLMINLSGAAMFVAPSRAVSPSRGIALSSGGGGVILDAEVDGLICAVAWFALANIAAAPLYRLVLRRDTQLAEGA